MNNYDDEKDEVTFEKMSRLKASKVRGAASRFFRETSLRVRATAKEGGLVRIFVREKHSSRLPILPVFRPLVYDMIREFDIERIATSSITPSSAESVVKQVTYVGEGVDRVGFQSPFLRYNLFAGGEQQDVLFYLFPGRFSRFREVMGEQCKRLLEDGKYSH